MSEKDDLLPARAEKLLADWPLSQPSEDVWETRALAIEAAIAAPEAQSSQDRDSQDGPRPSDDVLLSAPLPAEPGEGGGASIPDSAADLAPPEPPPISLAELARRSVEESAKDDDADLARDALSVASHARASQPLVPASVRAEAARIAVRAKAAEPAPVSPAVAAAPAPTPTPSRGPWIASALMLGGLVIAVAIVWRARQPADPLAYMPKPAEAPVAAAPAPAAAAPGSPEALSIDQLPGEAAKGAAASGSGKIPRAAGGAGALAVAPAADPSKPEAIAEPAAKPAPKAGPDEDEKGLKPAANPTDVPQKPSTGAVNAAIGSVLGGARACVAGHKEPSRATLTFGSDGRVQSVAVSGPAGGTAAEGCIRAALSRARVQPFSRPTFSVGVTVRP